MPKRALTEGNANSFVVLLLKVVALHADGGHAERQCSCHTHQAVETVQNHFKVATEPILQSLNEKQMQMCKMCLLALCSNKRIFFAEP